MSESNTNTCSNFFIPNSVSNYSYPKDLNATLSFLRDIHPVIESPFENTQNNFGYFSILDVAANKDCKNFRRQYRGNELENEIAKAQGKLNRYISVNDFYRPYNSTSHNIRTLNAIPVDLDYYKIPEFKNKTPEEMLDIILEGASKDFRTNPSKVHIPYPSSAICSGQGILLLYLIEPTTGHNTTCKLYNALCQSFVEHLQEFGADPKYGNPTSVMRIPGTKNIKTLEEVYVLFHDGNRRYTLSDLADQLLPHTREYHNSIIKPQRKEEKRAFKRLKTDQKKKAEKRKRFIENLQNQLKSNEQIRENLNLAKKECEVIEGKIQHLNKQLNQAHQDLDHVESLYYQSPSTYFGVCEQIKEEIAIFEFDLFNANQDLFIARTHLESCQEAAKQLLTEDRVKELKDQLNKAQENHEQKLAQIKQKNVQILYDNFARRIERGFKQLIKLRNESNILDGYREQLLYFYKSVLLFTNTDAGTIDRKVIAMNERFEYPLHGSDTTRMLKQVSPPERYQFLPSMDKIINRLGVTSEEQKQIPALTTRKSLRKYREMLRRRNCLGKTEKEIEIRKRREFILKKLPEMSVHELAQELECSLSTIKNDINYIYDHLAQFQDLLKEFWNKVRRYTSSLLDNEEKWTCIDFKRALLSLSIEHTWSGLPDIFWETDQFIIAECA